MRFPLVDREGESLVVWTTTPWTLPANVAAAVKPDAEYGLRDGGWRLAEEGGEYDNVVQGEDLVGLEYHAPFEDLPAQEGVPHRVIPWDEVALDEGTGIVHIAPGAGAEDFELSRVHGLAGAGADRRVRPLPARLRAVRGALDRRGGRADRRRRSTSAACSSRPGTIVHRYPICWRCKTPLVFRVVDDWFIRIEDLRQPLLDANDEVAWTPPNYKKRMDDWLRNMDDWNISRKRYFGLPLPFYPCECGELNVIGSRAELEERATGGLEQLQELHRPWIDEVPIRCSSCNEEVRRIPEVGDAWLDAGIVPLSTLGWENAEWVEHGYGTGAAKGLTGADLPDHAYWEQWFPADWISESREQIRLWFYSISVMAMTMTGRLPYRSVLTYERVHDETGREMHKSTGNAIEANEAFEQMGADIVRWQYCAQNPSQNINFGYGPAEEVKRRLLTLWNSAGFLVTYANIAGWQPKWDAQPSSQHALDRWLVARTGQLVAEGESAFERSWTPAVTTAFESYVEDLSNWYIRRSRRRFWDGEPEALETLWWSLVQALRVVAPLMPFLADHLWRALVPDGPDSVHLAGWPEAARPDETLLDEMAAVRRVVDARPPGARAVGPEAAPAAAAARRPGRRGRAGARRARSPRS